MGRCTRRWDVHDVQYTTRDSSSRRRRIMGLTIPGANMQICLGPGLGPADARLRLGTRVKRKMKTAWRVQMVCGGRRQAVSGSAAWEPQSVRQACHGGR
jgi:hypothetical protein